MTTGTDMVTLVTYRKVQSVMQLCKILCFYTGFTLHGECQSNSHIEYILRHFLLHPQQAGLGLGLGLYTAKILGYFNQILVTSVAFFLS